MYTYILYQLMIEMLMMMTMITMMMILEKDNELKL